MALTPGRRYLGHYVGLASDGKPIYLVYCCIESDEDETTPSGGVYGYYYGYYGYQGSGPPGDSAPGGGGETGVSCDNCLSRLCVVRDSNGRIVDVFYQDTNGNYVRVPDCSGTGYYGSQGSGSGSGSGGSGGSNYGCDCLPMNLSVAYVADYDITWNGNDYSGTLQGQLWNSDHIMWIEAIGTCVFNSMPSSLGFLPLQLGCRNGEWLFELVLYCGVPVCTIGTDDIDLTIANCPGSPTYTINIRPGRCMSGTIVIRPA